MKNVMIKLPLLVLLFSTLITHAQEEYLIDSVEYRMDKHLSMQIVARNFHELDEWPSTDSLYALFLKDLNKMDNEVLGDQQANNLTYKFDGPYRKIRINSPLSMDNEVSFDDEGNVLYFQVVEFEINEVERLIFKSPSLEGFNSMGKMKLDELVLTSDTIISPKGRNRNKRQLLVLYVENGTIQADKTINYTRPYDNIELRFGVGLGSVKTTLTPDFEAYILINLAKKGVTHNRFGISYQFLFFFQTNIEGEPVIKTDGFINLMYLRRSSGVKIGVMVDQNSMTFKNDAYKFALIHGFSKRLVIEGGFYWYDQFKETFPYMRLAMSFF